MHLLFVVYYYFLLKTFFLLMDTALLAPPSTVQLCVTGLTCTLANHCLTPVKLSSDVMSYITTTPSALRKNCLVMLRYLREGEEPTTR